MPDWAYMPGNRAQFNPPLSDYRHDLALALQNTYEVRKRVKAGERLNDVVKEIATKTVRAYLATPWTIWHPRVNMFLTPADAFELDYVTWMMKDRD